MPLSSQIQVRVIQSKRVLPAGSAGSRFLRAHAIYRSFPGLVRALFALLLCVPRPGSAQDEAVEVESDPVRATLASPILYLDVPVVYPEGVDPILPPPGLPLDPEQDPEFATRAVTISEYTETIARIEATGGAWDVNLVESLTALGNLQQAQGDHTAAVATLDRALHINRINSGLHTTEQIEIVEGLIESYTVLQNWESADLYHNYLFYIQQKAYGLDDPRMVPALARLGQWNLEAFAVGFGEPLGLRLSSANILYNAAVRILSLHFGREDERLVPYLLNIAQSAFLVASNPELMNEADRPQYRNNQDLLRDRLSERSSIIPMGFRVGESALMEIITLHQETGNKVGLAEAHVHLGDWYLLSERRRVAEAQYGIAQNLLSEIENDPEASPEHLATARSMRESLFSQVTPIPGFALQPRWLANPGTELPALDELQWDEVDLSFTVTRNGQVRNVDIISEESATDSGHHERVSRELRRYRFRPLLVDGVTVESRNNLVRFRFWY